MTDNAVNAVAEAVMIEDLEVVDPHFMCITCAVLSAPIPVKHVAGNYYELDVAAVEPVAAALYYLRDEENQ